MDLVNILKNIKIQAYRIKWADSSNNNKGALQFLQRKIDDLKSQPTIGDNKSSHGKYFRINNFCGFILIKYFPMSKPVMNKNDIAIKYIKTSS